MADLTLFTGRIETLDPRIGRTDAIAVRDGIVVAHGDRARALPGIAREVALDGFVMPGLIDAHNHHALAGQIDLYEFDCAPTVTIDELLAGLAEHCANLPEGAWATGGSWGSDRFDELSSLEALARLDAAAGGRPVMLRDDSKHNRWASSEAMRRAGITAASADPEGGQILRTDGVPNGVLIESAGVLVEHALAADEPLTLERRMRASERAIEMLHSHGITAFQDAAASSQLMHALRSLDDEGRLRAWVVTSMLVNDFIFGTEPLGEPIIAERETTASRHHRPDFIKIFLDGVPPSRTGAFLEPYLPDACGHAGCGEPTMSQNELAGWMRTVAQRGIGAKIHCTGDASVRMVLDAAETLRGEGLDARWHVAHGQFVQPEDVPRFARLDVTAEVSPSIWFPGVIPDAIATVLPSERLARMQPNRELLDAGARLVGGSDWPVAVSPNIWESVYGLVTRRDPSGTRTGALAPEQAITIDEAIRAYTVDSADALGIADVAGSLSEGRSADFIVLDVDPWSAPIEDVPAITARATWFAGEQVYERSGR